ncbi:hypothetical protein GCK32_019850 [Trichostrongylus colubriformis]|uniref:Uncharacterized protein n=1 Tax=Trichostrongylus colubriformis TaxID=6319 RepID=A0AAN8F0H1_TRICO
MNTGLTSWKMLQVLILPSLVTLCVSAVEYMTTEWVKPLVWFMFFVGFASGQWCVPGAGRNSRMNIASWKVRRNPSHSPVDKEQVLRGMSTKSIVNIALMLVVCVVLYSFLCHGWTYYINLHFIDL